jgi:hypothetical protein
MRVLKAGPDEPCPKSGCQKFAGVFALIISASSAPMLRNLCGKVVGK